MPINHFQFDGNLGRDAELKQVAGKDVCSFSVPVKKGWGDKQKTFWVRCTLWGNFAKTLYPYLKKGTYVSGNGEVSISEWEKDGANKFQIEVDVRQLSVPKSSTPASHVEEQSTGNDVPF